MISKIIDEELEGEDHTFVEYSSQMPSILKAHKIQHEIDQLSFELKKHQEKCKHKKVVKKYNSNTGNYDPTADSHWYSCFCPTCLKRWHEDA